MRSAAAVSVGEVLEYRTSFRDRAGWRAGQVQEVRPHEVQVLDIFNGRVCVIQPGRRGKVRALTADKMRQVLAHIDVARRAGALPATITPGGAAQPAKVLPLTGAAPIAVVARVGTPAADRSFYPLQRPRGRIQDLDYLAWVRTLECLGCGPEARAETEPHHYGPRPVGRKTDDLRSVPACRLCHRQLHGTSRSLPGLTAGQTALHLLQSQARLLLLYPAHAAALGIEDVARWVRLLEAVDQLPAAQRAQQLRDLIDLLVERLQGGRGGNG